MKILLVQTSFLGDTILSTPVIQGIKDLHPEAELWMMTTPLSSGLVRKDPLLSGVLPLDKRKKDKGVAGLLRMSRKLKAMKFDRVYSLHRSYRTALMLWLARIPLRIGCSNAKGRFLYHRLASRDFSQHDVVRNMSILSGEADLDPDTMEMRLYAPTLAEISPTLRTTLTSRTPYAVMAPGSAWKTKMWHWEGYRAIVQYLLAKHIGVLLIGAQSERAICEKVAKGLPVVDFSGQSTIEETLAIVKNACLMVCNDSMALHMASAMKIPTAVFFCATSPSFGYGPWKNSSVIIEQKGLDCKPCRRHGSMKCPNNTEACMQGPDNDVVYQAIEQVLTSSNKCCGDNNER